MANKKVTAADTTADPKQFWTSAEMASYNDYMDEKRARAERTTAAKPPKERGYKAGGKIPKGMHRMPDGSVMKDSEHTGMKKGGSVSSASKRADGIAKRGHTRGRMM